MSFRSIVLTSALFTSLLSCGLKNEDQNGSSKSANSLGGSSQLGACELLKEQEHWNSVSDYACSNGTFKCEYNGREDNLNKSWISDYSAEGTCGTFSARTKLLQILCDAKLNVFEDKIKCSSPVTALTVPLTQGPH